MKSSEIVILLLHHRNPSVGLLFAGVVLLGIHCKGSLAASFVAKVLLEHRFFLYAMLLIMLS